MKIEQWIDCMSESYQTLGKQFTSDKKSLLLTEFSEDCTKAQKEVLAEAMDIMTRFFYIKASRGETFGPVARIKEKLGSSPEENYGLSTGPFINMAKTYWTYKLEVQDLFPEHHKTLLSQILLKIEIDIAGLFFPSPGISMPDSLRKMTQRKFLQEYAPMMDVERFLSESPILKKSSGRGGCLGIILMCASISASILVIVMILFIYQ
jgi:hypothetical protein